MKYTTTFLISLINLHQVSLACGLILAISLKHTTWQITEKFSDDIIFYFKNKHEGWDSVVGVVTCYRLDSQTLMETRFFGPIQTGPKAHSATCIMGARCLTQG
jgi:hypothetical protein